MVRINRASTYSGEELPPITLSTIEQVIRESGGQQLPPGSVPEDRVAPSTTEGDVQVTQEGKTQWTASENLSGVITARSEAEQAALDAAAADAAALAAAADAAAAQNTADTATASASAAATAAASAAADAAAAQSTADGATSDAATANAAAVAAANDAAAAQAAADTAASNLTDHLNDTLNAHMASAIGSVATGDVVATDVQSAIAELASEKATTGSVTAVSDALNAHITDTTAHAASYIPLADAGGHYAATNVEDALTEIAVDVENHIADATDAHDASAISVLDTLAYYAATDVEGALAEAAASIVAVSNDLGSHENLSFGAGHALPTAATPMNGYGFTSLGDLDFSTNPNFKIAGTAYMQLGSSYLYLGSGVSKAAIQFNDTWLRLNPSGGFTAGIYCGTSVVRTDNQFQVGASGAGALLSTNTLRLGGDAGFTRTAAGILKMDAGDKLQQNAAPTVGDDLTNKTYVDAHINDTSDAHDASAISVLDAGGYFASTDVEAALQEAGAPKQASDVSVTPSGLIVVTTDVQSALVKLEQGIDDLRDEFEGHHHGERNPYFHLYQSAGSTAFAATTSYQSIAWTAEAYDSEGVFTPGASATTYTVPLTGWWMLGYEIIFVSGAYGANTITFNGRVLGNSVTQMLVHITSHVGTGQPALAKAKPVYLTAGHTIELQLARSDGFAPTTIGGDSEYTNFWGRYLGARPQ